MTQFSADARNSGLVKGAAAILNVSNVEQTLLWYQDELGLQVEFAWGDPVVHGSVRAGNTSFHFQAAEVTEPATAYMTLYVDQLDKLYADICQRDVETLGEPELMPWGMQAFMVRDCNGALVMFADPSTGE